MIKYITQELAKYWPLSPELMAQYKDGDKPAQIYADGYLEWRQNCQRHRDNDKPAIIWADGTLEWFQNDKLHRDDDKPAYISTDGTLAWSQNGQWHRSRGPAVIWPDGRLRWWINYEEITQKVNEWLDGEEWHGTPEQIFEFQLRFS